MAIHRRYDAFICYYRRSGATLAQLFRANLEARGLRVFLDVEAVYWGPFPDELKARIRETPCLIVLLTTGCLDSPWLKLEIAEALKTERKIMVVCDSDFVMPAVEALDPELKPLTMLNHISYSHEFSDQVVRRVAMQVASAARRPRRLWRASVALAVCAVAGVWMALAWSDRTPQAEEVAPRPHPEPPAVVERPQPAVVVEPPMALPVEPQLPKAEPAVTTGARSARAKSAVKSTPRSTPDPCAISYWFDEYGEKHYRPECYLERAGDR